ncbi:MAG: DUF4062 domain-containing protein [Merismopedia sp. SIO2A8]|nr:DUF4062 domain-containing protein [Symploca sp. SIO2B6]NET51804.1 DUF4062 domain-containing protein [Merismopedia sp. SIO2A8]
MARIYISSTYSDLKEHREQVYHTLRQMGHDVVAMEDYVATSQHSPLEKCLADVDKCDLYLGIFAWRYGYIPDDGNPQHKSITELEYRQASGRGKPCLVFLLDEEAHWLPKFMDTFTSEGEGGKRIKQLRQQLATSKMVSFFKTPQELANQVAVALQQWEQESVEELSPEKGTIIAGAEAMVSTGNQNVIQSGTGNINIGQGTDISIGKQPSSKG